VTAAWTAAIAAVVALAWAASTWLLVRALNRASADAVTREQLAHLIADFTRQVNANEAAHQGILATLRDDRRATDQRLRWLEEHQWTRSPTGR
jgi:thioredoxin-like negative regulator of GroEL